HSAQAVLMQYAWPAFRARWLRWLDQLRHAGVPLRCPHFFQYVVGQSRVSWFSHSLACPVEPGMMEELAYRLRQGQQLLLLDEHVLAEAGEHARDVCWARLRQHMAQLQPEGGGGVRAIRQFAAALAGAGAADQAAQSS